MLFSNCRILRSVALSSFCILLCYSVFSQNQKYLDGMPTQKDIIENIKGDNTFDTYTKQAGALEMLWNMIRFNKMSPYKVKDSPKETEKLGIYNMAIGELKKEYSQKYEHLVSGTNAELKWNRSVMKYSDDKDLKKYIVDNLFKADAKEAYEKMQKKIAFKTRQPAISDTAGSIPPNDQSNLLGFLHLLIGIGGTAILIFAFVLNKKLDRYEFEHRTSGGVVEFESYEKKLWHYRKKALATYMYIAGTTGIIIGFVFG